MNNRDPIVGDLLEEFRTCILPSQGRARAVIWVGRQAVSFVRPWMWGCALGLAVTVFNPVLASLDSIGLQLPFVLFMIALAAVGFGAARAKQQWHSSILAAAVAGSVSAVVGEAVGPPVAWVTASADVNVRDYLLYLARNPWLSEAGIGLAFGALGGVVGGGIEFVVRGRMRVS